ncbi:MAG: zf-HC2 domain-containing protein [Gemmatimonadota bacterium]|nr:zf-HC2 domain-containing protein [Gemmatimonadota bacterium]
MIEGRKGPPENGFRQLMMAAVDDEISPEERAELDAALAGDPKLRDEWEAFKRLREVTRTMTTREPPAEVWDSYWEGVYRRFERGLGWILVSLSAIVLITWGTWEWVQEILADTELPGFIRWAVLGLAAGLIVLFVSVARERWFARKSDPYKDLIR